MAAFETQRSGKTRTRMLCERTKEPERGCQRRPHHSIHRDSVLAAFIGEITICILVAEHAFNIQAGIEC